MEPILILYGSQTGNSEEISKEIYNQLTEIGYECKINTLNSVTKVALNDICNIVIVVCSTTGNGDPPYNAELFWKFIKLRSNPKKLFESIHFVVLGLGNSNYNKFCQMGKSLDKRFEELGAKRIFELTCIDEVDDLEEQVEHFKSKLFTVLPNIVDTYKNKYTK